MFRILQNDGENYAKADECVELGKVVLDKVPEGPAGEPDLIVTFDIGKDGRLKVEARDADEINAADVAINIDKKQMTADELPKAFDEIAVFVPEEHKDHEANGARIAFQRFMDEMKANKNTGEKMDRLTEADKTTLDVCIDLGDEFLKEATAQSPATEFEVKMAEIKAFYDALEEKMNGDLEGYPEVREIEAYPEPKMN